jgi:hypothetical protein
VVVTPVDRPWSAPILVAFDAPGKQRRITVATRPVLVLPHLVAFVLLGPAALVVTVAGWFGALVLGRLPRFAADFLPGYLMWQTRLYAYLFFLTDVYPPFSLSDAPYPVRVTAQPGPLNRWAVAFRLLLAVPAAVVAATVTYGIAGVVLVVTWLTVFVNGRFPTSLHQVFAAFVRYEARLVGYLTMVTSEYPWGLLGDPETSTPVPIWQPAPPAPPQDPYWQVVLTSRAKNFVVFVLVVGVASVVCFNVATAASRYHRLQTEEAAGARVQDAYQSLSTAVIGYGSRTRSCGTTRPPLPCLTGAARTVSEAFSVFVGRLSTTAMPASAIPARHVLVSDGTRAEEDFAQLSASSSAGHYQLAIEDTNLPRLLLRFDRDYVTLGTRLDDLG